MATRCCACFFEQQGELQVVGEVESGEQLLARLPTTPCDVVLLDLHMPGPDGLATTRRLRAEFPDVRVLVLSMNDQALAIGQVMEARARGYVLKNAGHDEIVVGVRGRGRRQAVSVLRAGPRHAGQGADWSRRSRPRPSGGLTPRELEILRLVADGLTNAQIADQLYTSPRTIETHRQNIMEKTGAKNTAAVIKAAASKGWLS